MEAGGKCVCIGRGVQRHSFYRDDDGFAVAEHKIARQRYLLPVDPGIEADVASLAERVGLFDGPGQGTRAGCLGVGDGKDAGPGFRGEGDVRNIRRGGDFRSLGQPVVDDDALAPVCLDEAAHFFGRVVGFTPVVARKIDDTGGNIACDSDADLAQVAVSHRHHSTVAARDGHRALGVSLPEGAVPEREDAAGGDADAGVRAEADAFCRKAVALLAVERAARSHVQIPQDDSTLRVELQLVVRRVQVGVLQDEAAAMPDDDIALDGEVAVRHVDLAAGVDIEVRFVIPHDDGTVGQAQDAAGPDRDVMAIAAADLGDGDVVARQRTGNRDGVFQDTATVHGDIPHNGNVGGGIHRTLERDIRERDAPARSTKRGLGVGIAVANREVFALGPEAGGKGMRFGRGVQRHALERHDDGFAVGEQEACGARNALSGKGGVKSDAAGAAVRVGLFDSPGEGTGTGGCGAGDGEGGRG